MICDGFCLILGGLLHREPQLPDRCSRVRNRAAASMAGIDFARSIRLANGVEKAAGACRPPFWLRAAY